MNKEEARKRICQRLLEVRKMEGLTQTDLEQRSGIRQNHIARIEQGCYDVRIDTLSQLAQAMGYRLDFVKEN